MAVSCHHYSVVHGTNVFHTQWRNVVSIGTIEQSTGVNADSNMRLTRHNSDSTAFEAPVNSSQHGVSAACRSTRHTILGCDELTV